MANSDAAPAAITPAAEPGDEPLPNAPAADETPAETETVTTESNIARAPATEESEIAGELVTAETEKTAAQRASETAPNLLPDDVATPFHTAVNHANQAVALIPNAANPKDWQRIAPGMASGG